MSFNQLPGRKGLYNSEFEHDSCGVGFVCDIKGRISRKIVEDGLEMISRMNHRGASGADPDSGDGAGILVQLPHRFLTKVASRHGISLGEIGSYGCGIVFLPKSRSLRERCRKDMEEACNALSLKIALWRPVPVREDLIGMSARQSMPCMEMVFVVPATEGPFSTLPLEQRLFLARKKAEWRIIERDGISPSDFYVSSLSSRTIVYKGMLTPPQLAPFFPDVQDPDFESAIALIHSRFSTNTFPSWDRSQPFRYLAHNGEINTLKGNSTWMRSRESALAKSEWGNDLSELFPLIQKQGSDSQALDNVFEFLLQSGRDMSHVMSMLVPAAWEGDDSIDPSVRDFYRYHRCMMESWDGPAALAYTDGTIVAASLDRNGLRPGRYLVTSDDRVIMASELGVLDVPPEMIVQSLRLEPGKMLYIDTSRALIISDREVKLSLARRAPWGQWLSQSISTLEQKPVGSSVSCLEDTVFRSLYWTREETEMIVAPMAIHGLEPIGSMGNDAPHAVLSEKTVPLFSFFRQLFAQVTNPPIDPLREGCVMSLETVIGPQGNILDQGPSLARRLVLPHPVLTEETLKSFVSDETVEVRTISILFDPQEGEKGFLSAVDRICKEASDAAEKGVGYLVLSDRGIMANRVSLPSLLALGAVHQSLSVSRSRNRVALMVESAECREVHHLCLLFGYGADAVIPYGAYAAISKLIATNDIEIPYDRAVNNYIHALEHGVMKTLSKMGISTLMSYKGAQIFEAVGLSLDVIDRCFTGTPSRVGGIDMSDIARRTIDNHRKAYSFESDAPHLLESGGFYRWRNDGELHAWNPKTIALFQQAVRSGDYNKFREYTEAMDSQRVNLRSLLSFVKREPIDLDLVESEESILSRFATGAMSYGSISAGAHTTIARAMNRLGGKSNTGEGGEDPARFTPLENGDSLCSRIKQVASGRFGVTTWYLSNADEIQIKMAQGAKPGEGGQLPGHKVSQMIARTRYTTEGVTLISPPPHHDIYSIEDLAQLILDLKNVNPDARISVKLVSEMGVGTVAAGVAKAQADMILISGADGGTGASPLSSIKHAGLPWELGLAETHQTLVMNGLRDRLRVQCDGGMRTGRDLAIACLLGADEFGFATGALIAMGCVMLRHCHLNNCSMGVATQDDRCAARFSGKSEYVENFMRFTARHLREIMASLGMKTLDEMRGRSDLLVSAAGGSGIPLDFSHILAQGKKEKALEDIDESPRVDLRQEFDKRLITLTKEAVETTKPIRLSLDVRNTDRAVGAMLSGHIMKKRGEKALPSGTIRCELTGTAGQSFGAWLCSGVEMRLTGFANDYVGKGLFGGVLSIRASDTSPLSRVDASPVLAGNTALYGAISGELYIAGRAGERFCVRNSGATAVVEGVGDHGCEYMTGGLAVVLGSVGRNFAAGMSGGMAFVFDKDKTFERKFNDEFADLESLTERDVERLRMVLSRHAELTGSVKARSILEDFSHALPLFRKVMPRDYRSYLEKKGEL